MSSSRRSTKARLKAQMRKTRCASRLPQVFPLKASWQEISADPEPYPLQVGAGAQVPVFDAYEKGDGPQVECPPGLSPHGIVAVEVEGDSMEPIYSDGDLLFYTRNGHDAVLSDDIGHRCVCEDEDGMGWVKQIKPGDEPGLFHLISLNPGANNIWNVRLKWAARVRLHWPVELAKKN
jgi:phage repressor protein C with HTH and peptisase S24 domain